jgi:SynChlorMet cassette radical SAM/SPASM protein ScmF
LEEIMENNKEKITYPLNCIYFYLTEGCNLRCRHCWIMPESKEKKRANAFLGVKLFQSIIDQAVPLGLSSLKLTGGEPFYHPRIVEILEIVKKTNLNLSIETNGVLCSPEIAKSIKECKNPGVSISLDGSKAKTHEWMRGVEGCFDKALEGVRNLLNEGIRPQLIMSIVRHNKDQMEEVVRLAEREGCESVKFNLVHSVGRAKEMAEAGGILDIEEYVRMGEWVERKLKPSTPIRIFYSHPPAFLPLNQILDDKMNGACGTCGILGIIGVLANGSYALCGIGENVPELVFGDAEKISLKEVWDNDLVINEIRERFNSHFEGICADCAMQKICRRYCIAQNYYRDKSLWAPFWYCQEARNRGLFPESRVLIKHGQ